MGVDVVIIDNFERSGGHGSIDPILLEAEESNGRVDFFRIDIRKDDLPDISVDYVFHLAAKVYGVKRLHRDVVDIMTSNILGDMRVFKWAASMGVKRLIYASSSYVYDHPDIIPPYREGEEMVPNTFYGLSKLFGEKLLEAYREEGALEWSIARLFNIYGPFESLNEPHVIPEFFIKAYNILRGTTDVFEIVGDGNQTRSFLYVDDAVDALIAMMSHPKAMYEVFNIGTDREVSIKNLACLVLKTVGIDIDKVRFRFTPAPIRDAKRRSANYMKAEKTLGWTPKIDLETGLKATWDWIRPILEKG